MQRQHHSQPPTGQRGPSAGSHARSHGLPDEADDVPADGPMTDAERYRWIRAHRGSALITTALLSADSDVDLDSRIDDAARLQRFGRPAEPAVASNRPVYGRRRTD